MNKLRQKLESHAFPTHAADAERLMRQADAAMYSAKRARAGSALYDPTRDAID